MYVLPCKQRRPLIDLTEGLRHQAGVLLSSNQRGKEYETDQRNLSENIESQF